MFIAGKIHYFDWAIFNSKLLVYQRVNIAWQMVGYGFFTVDTLRGSGPQA
jgi:hypothetical protein